MFQNDSEIKDALAVFQCKGISWFWIPATVLTLAGIGNKVI